MSLAQITEKIERDARAEADRITSEARTQEKIINDETAAEVRKLEESAKARFEKERPEIFKRREIVARLDVNKIRLDAQRRLIGDVFAEGLAGLTKLGKDEYVAFFGRLLKEASAGGDEILELSKGEKYIDAAWLESFNAANGTKIKLSEKKGDYSGGFILGKGRIFINCSWEMLMRNAQERMENEVVRRLFPAA
jgi:V/A-type H+-transporting ATPase subunit E